MKIWGIGLSRTGTTSLADILKSAGLHVVHYPSEAEIFSGINNGACDLPVVIRYKEVDKRFPGSKFVYTVREKDQWVNSIVPYLERKRNWKMSPIQINTRVQVYGVPFPNKEQAWNAYEKHDNDVKEYFKDRPNDLLILNIIGGDSPDKLWSFIGLHNPPKAFPHSNKLNK